MILRSLIALVLIAATAAAEPPKADAPKAEPPKPPALKIEGTFGFDTMKPKQKCTKVAGALLTKLSKLYTCAPPDNGGETGSGVKYIGECKVKKGPASEYMLFASAADCDKERETQLANAG
jgi:hypothetical protein